MLLCLHLYTNCAHIMYTFLHITHRDVCMCSTGVQLLKLHGFMHSNLFLVNPLQNVVVVNQPSAPPQTIHVVHNRANNHMVLTLVMMVLCFLHGNLPAFICLIPALCFAVVVSRHNKSNNNVNKQPARISKVNGRNNGSISWSGLVNLSTGKFHQNTRFMKFS